MSEDYGVVRLDYIPEAKQFAANATFAPLSSERSQCRFGVLIAVPSGGDGLRIQGTGQNASDYYILNPGEKEFFRVRDLQDISVRDTSGAGVTVSYFRN